MRSYLSAAMICLLVSGIGCAKAQAFNGATSTEPSSSSSSSSSSVTAPVDISGHGTSSIGSLSISGSIGSIEINGRAYSSYIYRAVPWGDFDEYLYQGIAGDSSHLYIYWVYCNPKKHFDSVWWEGTNGPAINWDIAKGSCEPTPPDSTATPDSAVRSVFATINLQAILPQHLLSQFSISGPNLNYTPGSPGSFRTSFGGTEEDFAVYPFGTVDCSHDCGPRGWYEMHTLFVNKRTNDACFAIVYLRLETKTPETQYWICLSDLSQPTAYEDWNATWSKL